MAISTCSSVAVVCAHDPPRAPCCFSAHATHLPSLGPAGAARETKAGDASGRQAGERPCTPTTGTPGASRALPVPAGTAARRRSLTCSAMRASDSLMRTSASSCRTVTGTGGTSVSSRSAALRACTAGSSRTCKPTRHEPATLPTLAAERCILAPVLHAAISPAAGPWCSTGPVGHPRSADHRAAPRLPHIRAAAPPKRRAPSAHLLADLHVVGGQALVRVVAQPRVALGPRVVDVAPQELHLLRTCARAQHPHGTPSLHGATPPRPLSPRGAHSRRAQACARRQARVLKS